MHGDSQDEGLDFRQCWTFVMHTASDSANVSVCLPYFASSPVCWSHTHCAFHHSVALIPIPWIGRHSIRGIHVFSSFQRFAGLENEVHRVLWVFVHTLSRSPKSDIREYRFPHLLTAPQNLRLWLVKLPANHNVNVDNSPGWSGLQR
jgi:hypothetical protein